MRRFFVESRNPNTVYYCHYSDVIMGTMASQTTRLTIVYSTVYSGVDQRKHQSSASLSFVRGIHRWPVNSQTKGQLRGKCFQLMTSSCISVILSWFILLNHHDKLTNTVIISHHDVIKWIFFFASLVLCEGSPPVTIGFPTQRSVPRSFNVFFDLRLNKRFS